jgi:hypothetical protein
VQVEPRSEGLLPGRCAPAGTLAAAAFGDELRESVEDLDAECLSPSLLMFAFLGCFESAGDELESLVDGGLEMLDVLLQGCPADGSACFPCRCLCLSRSLAVFRPRLSVQGSPAS